MHKNGDSLTQIKDLLWAPKAKNTDLECINLGKLEELCPKVGWSEANFACSGGPQIFRLRDDEVRVEPSCNSQESIG